MSTSHNRFNSADDDSYHSDELNNDAYYSSEEEDEDKSFLSSPSTQSSFAPVGNPAPSSILHKIFETSYRYVPFADIFSSLIATTLPFKIRNAPSSSLDEDSIQSINDPVENHSQAEREQDRDNLSPIELILREADQDSLGDEEINVPNEVRRPNHSDASINAKNQNFQIELDEKTKNIDQELPSSLDSLDESLAESETIYEKNVNEISMLQNEVNNNLTRSESLKNDIDPLHNRINQCYSHYVDNIMSAPLEKVLSESLAIKNGIEAIIIDIKKIDLQNVDTSISNNGLSLNAAQTIFEDACQLSKEIEILVSNKVAETYAQISQTMETFSLRRDAITEKLTKHKNVINDSEDLHAIKAQNDEIGKSIQLLKNIAADFNQLKKQVFDITSQLNNDPNLRLFSKAKINAAYDPLLFSIATHLAHVEHDIAENMAIKRKQDRIIRNENEKIADITYFNKVKVEEDEEEDNLLAGKYDLVSDVLFRRILDALSISPSLGDLELNNTNTNKMIQTTHYVNKILNAETLEDLIKKVNCDPKIKGGYSMRENTKSGFYRIFGLFNYGGKSTSDDYALSLQEELDNLIQNEKNDIHLKRGSDYPPLTKDRKCGFI